MLEAWESRKDAYANHWKVGLCTAPCEDCPCTFKRLSESIALRFRLLFGFVMVTPPIHVLFTDLFVVRIARLTLYGNVHFMAT